MSTTFQHLYGSSPSIRADAPGRVNLMGDHTDYNEGLVLPAAIPQRTEVEAAPGRGRRVRVWSDQFPAAGPVAYQLGAEAPAGDWADYVRGMTQALARYGLSDGFDARIASTVPLGSGLSSSASLEIALGRALRALFGLDLDDIALARAGQRAENDFVGAPVGLLDQLACGLSDQASALFLDTRTLLYERVPLPAGAGVIVVHSGIVHSNATGGYAIRRRECSQAAAALGVESLRDLTDADWHRISALTPPFDRRVRHVMTENARVIETVAAFRSGEVAAIGRLFSASHQSLRDDYQVSIPEIDAIVESASGVRGSYGARLTGGGFGGSVVIIADATRLDEVTAGIVAGARRRAGPQVRAVVPPR